MVIQEVSFSKVINQVTSERRKGRRYQEGKERDEE
jgi:hypothetical protein